MDAPRAVDETSSPMLCYRDVHVNIMSHLAQPTTEEEDKVSIPEADNMSCAAGWGFKVSIDSHSHLPHRPADVALYRSGLMKIHAWMHTT
jgi:hypothetical protein